MATAYYGLFRVGELASGEHRVKAGDVHVSYHKRKMLFILRSSKTHTKGSRPQMVKITSLSQNPHPEVGKLTHKRNKTQHPCPFELLQNYIKVRGPRTSVEEPFFIMIDKSPVTPQQCNTCLKSTLKLANFDESLYSMHSLRAG